jgi:hypothetical protein
VIREYKTPASPDNIYVVEGFMEKEHAEELHRLCNLSLEDPSLEEWWYNKFPGPEYIEYTFGAYRQICEEQIINYHENKNPLLNFYMQKMLKLISYTVGKKVVPIFHFNRHKSVHGITCPGHTDSEARGQDSVMYLADYSPNHHYEPSIMETSANIYLNNNYDDGLLYFPEYDVKIRHRPGQLVFFPATVEYVHAVETVLNGTRWNLISHLARPKLIIMHSAMYNMWHMLSDEQKKNFPSEWEDEFRPRGVREGHVK